MAPLKGPKVTCFLNVEPIRRQSASQIVNPVTIQNKEVPRQGGCYESKK